MERTLHPRTSATHLSVPSTPHGHRPIPTVRSTPQLPSYSHRTDFRPRTLLPVADFKPTLQLSTGSKGSGLELASPQPTLWGMRPQLKYISLVTLAVQNATLSIVMHHSRVSTPPHLSYSPASAVLLNEILKGSISLCVVIQNVMAKSASETPSTKRHHPWNSPFQILLSEILSPDCWKLSIPAILYVVQNSLQFVAISNLPVASFQVSYQMKILTTAAFSVVLLRKKLSATKWLSLFFLAIGVGIVQIQTAAATASPDPMNEPVGSAHESAPLHVHVMRPLTGFAAVIAACFTSGLAGVYFEMVLKNSKADLWVRNVQLSLFSLIPALLPILYAPSPPHSRGFFMDLFRNFGWWAWATVTIQVFGGLVTAMVIKYSDNILKGFATSLSIILSFLASVVLFDFTITPSFVIGATTVLVATWMYNQPGKEPYSAPSITDDSTSSSVSTPVSPHSPILGQLPSEKKSMLFGGPRAVASALGMRGSDSSQRDTCFPDMQEEYRYQYAPYGSPFPSRTPTPDLR